MLRLTRLRSIGVVDCFHQHLGFTCAEYREYIEAPKCRFCRDPVTARSQRLDDKGALVPNVCNQADCGERLQQCCTKSLPCGHACYGARDETVCPPCLHPDCSAAALAIGVSVCADSECAFCTEGLAS
jgi:E3 ubiquitin-protein ligase MYCBP2